MAVLVILGLILASIACGGNTYEVVRVQKDAVDQAGVTYDGIEVETKMDSVERRRGEVHSLRSGA